MAGTRFNPALPLPSGPRLRMLSLWLGLAALYGPTYWELLFGRMSGYAQGHEPLVLAAAGWLVWSRRKLLAALPGQGAPRAATALLLLGLLMYWFGHTQQFVRIELLSQVPVVAAMLLSWRGAAALRLAMFPLVLLLFAVPLPYSVVMAVTGPLKTAVSMATTGLLKLLGYPIGRSGVVITIGQYQLLVAEACAGLQTMFALEAVGLAYAHLMNYKAWQRTAIMAVAAVPVAFVANVVRTTVLVLVTYHLGDEIGRGFVHGFAGLLLFVVALLLLRGLDLLLNRSLPQAWRL